MARPQVQYHPLYCCHNIDCPLRLHKHLPPLDAVYFNSDTKICIWNVFLKPAFGPSLVDVSSLQMFMDISRVSTWHNDWGCNRERPSFSAALRLMQNCRRLKNPFLEYWMVSGAFESFKFLSVNITILPDWCSFPVWKHSAVHTMEGLLLRISQYTIGEIAAHVLQHLLVP